MSYTKQEKIKDFALASISKGKQFSLYLLISLQL